MDTHISVTYAPKQVVSAKSNKADLATSQQPVLAKLQGNGMRKTIVSNIKVPVLERLNSAVNNALNSPRAVKGIEVLNFSLATAVATVVINLFAALYTEFCSAFGCGR